ncbi:MAG: nucleotidyltransferase family protein [Clostridia bacterium]|nr:nucleotidyltransferase family protein [Clostridia bacterium]
MSVSYVKYFLDIIRAVLNGTPFEKTSENIDFEGLYSFASAHHMAGVIAWCDEAILGAPEEIRQKFNYEKNRSIAREALQEVVISAFLESMEKEGLRAMPLKGFCIKNLYPHPALRSMTDTDILIDKGDMEKIIPIMEGLGLKYDHDTINEAIFQNDRMVVELHKELIPSNMRGRLCDYYRDHWRLARPKPDKKYICEMTPEDFYIFAICHIAKHYVGGGIGIKHIMDVYILNRSEYDWTYINSEFEKLGLVEFSEIVRELSCAWFGKGPWPNLSPATLELSAAILDSGAFGRGKERAVSGIYLGKRKTDKKHSVTGALLRRIFPPIAHMKLLYPQVKKHGFLYPFFLVVRIFDICFNRKNELKNLKNSTSIGEKDVDMFAQRLKKAGIPEDF